MIKFLNIFQHKIVLIFFLFLFFLSSIETKIAFIDIFDQLIFQVFIIGLFLACINFLFRKILFFIFYLIISIILFLQIINSCEQCSHQISDINQNFNKINIMTLNAGYSSENNELNNIIGIIMEKNVDVLFLQEISPDFQKKLKNLNNVFLYQVGLNKDIKFWDSVILSKYPLIDSHNNLTNATQATLLFNNKKITIVGIHLYPPIKQRLFISTINQMNYWSDFFKSSNNEFIFVGDLNMTNVSKRFKNFLKEANLFTHSSIFKPNFTWPSFLPNFMGIQIDHILFSKHFKIMNKEVVNQFSSDHRALFATLVLESEI